MKNKSHTILIFVQAMVVLFLTVILAFAAKRCFVFADIRILTTAIIQQESGSGYPPSITELAQRKLDNDRAVSIAKRESEKWKQLGRLLLFAEVIPVALIGTLLWSISMQRKQNEN